MAANSSSSQPIKNCIVLQLVWAAACLKQQIFLIPLAWLFGFITFTQPNSFIDLHSFQLSCSTIHVQYLLHPLTSRGSGHERMRLLFTAVSAEEIVAAAARRDAAEDALYPHLHWLLHLHLNEMLIQWEHQVQ